MRSLLAAQRLPPAAVLICVIFLTACTVGTTAHSVSNPVDYDSANGAAAPAYPPTPTFPVLDAPIRLPDNGTQDGEAIRPEAQPTTRVNAVKQRPFVQMDPLTAIENVTPSMVALPTPEMIVPPTATPTPCAKPGQIATGEFESPLAGRIGYRVYLPPCYSSTGGRYPVLYMLPGNIHTDSIWDELGLDEAAETGIREGRYPPFVIVMVSGGSLANYTSGGPGSYESFMLEEFLPFVEQAYCVSTQSEGRAIGGLSRGGYWALEIAFRHPQDFASVGGHSAALLDFNGGPTINPSQTGLTSDLADLRIYLDIGQDDWLIANVRLLHEEMVQADRKHTWLLNEGAHEEAYWAAHVFDYLDWYTEPWQEWANDSEACPSHPDAGAP